MLLAIAVFGTGCSSTDETAQPAAMPIPFAGLPEKPLSQARFFADSERMTTFLCEQFHPLDLRDATDCPKDIARHRAECQAALALPPKSTITSKNDAQSLHRRYSDCLLKRIGSLDPSRFADARTDAG
jgi:hypothetical protein